MSAKTVAVRLLSRRDHSIYELNRKLEQREFPQDEIDDALHDLVQHGYLSDERFAESYVRMRRQKGYGPVKIGLELRERGVSESVYNPFLHGEESLWLETLERVYQNKYRGEPVEDIRDKAKRVRFLQYRGFPLEKIHEIID